MVLMKLGKLLAFPLALALLSGCPFSPGDKKITPPPPDPYLEQTSPENVLKNLRKAYEERTIDEYAKLFDREEFFFEFSDRDRQTDPNIPAEWGYTEDQASTRNLFQDETVNKIVLTLTIPDRVQATEADQLPGGPEGVWKVATQNVHLEVHTTNVDGEPLEYLVARDGAEFFFREYPQELSSPSRLPIWRIVRWRDKPAGALFSFGEVKQRLAL